jgi:hypothetical protein
MVMVQINSELLTQFKQKDHWLLLTTFGPKSLVLLFPINVS